MPMEIVESRDNIRVAMILRLSEAKATYDDVRVALNGSYKFSAAN